MKNRIFFIIYVVALIILNIAIRLVLGETMFAGIVHMILSIILFILYDYKTEKFIFKCEEAYREKYLNKNNNKINKCT